LILTYLADLVLMINENMCVAGHQNFGCKELEECGIKWGRMAGNSEEGQGPQRAVAPMMMMINENAKFSPYIPHKLQNPT
jgi:hypothetical protein